MWRSCIFRCLQMVGLTPNILAYVFTLKRTLCSKIPARSLMFLKFAFKVKTFGICVCCMQISRWNGVSSTILTLLQHRSKWSRTVLSYKAVWIYICSSVAKCTEINRMDLEAPISSNIYTVTNVSSATNAQIVKILDIHFQVKKSVLVINMGFRLAYLYLTLIHSKGQGHAQCTFRLWIYRKR